MTLQPLATTRSDRKSHRSMFMHVVTLSKTIKMIFALLDVCITGLPYAMRDIVVALQLLYCIIVPWDP